MRKAHNFVDLTGRVFGRLTVAARAPNRYGGKAFWSCVCTCGGSAVTSGSQLVSGHTASCGCLNRETITKHGRHNSSEYVVWQQMKERCHNPKKAAYARYGARGVTVCERWRGSFASFLQDMGHRPGADFSLERRDNDGPYSPDNCRWATRRDQCRNRRANVWLELDGVRMCVTDWCAQYGIDSATVAYRLKSGWDPATALAAPPHYKFRTLGPYRPPTSKGTNDHPLAA